MIYLFFLSEPNVGVPGVYFSLYTLVVTVVTVSVSVTLSFSFYRTLLVVGLFMLLVVLWRWLEQVLWGQE